MRAFVQLLLARYWCTSQGTLFRCQWAVAVKIRGMKWSAYPRMQRVSYWNSKIDDRERQKQVPNLSACGSCMLQIKNHEHSRSVVLAMRLVKQFHSRFSCRTSFSAQVAGIPRLQPTFFLFRYALMPPHVCMHVINMWAQCKLVAFYVFRVV